MSEQKRTGADPTKPSDTGQGEMPRVPMSADAGQGAGGGGVGDGGGREGEPAAGEEFQNVIVVMRVPKHRAADHVFQATTQMRDSHGLQIDPDFTPVPVPGHEAFDAENDVVLVRAKVPISRLDDLKTHPDIIDVKKDTKIAPFRAATAPASRELALAAPQAPCAINPCDIDPGTAKGTLADVVRYLGVDAVWNAGYRGKGIRIGMVDGGVTAIGRVPRAGETARIPRVVAGWPADWGTTASDWGDHGNMTSTDALGIAPEAEIYDIRISGTSTISSAIAGYQWAIERHRQDGTPQVLSNSWGIYQKDWDPEYAGDPNHPFTLKVVEAIREGILVLFAAGNCGAARPSTSCGADAGPGRSIWGANGHPLVMTVGAANERGEWIGYTSQGPAALDPRKPDFCGISHFRGYFAVDTGTSAACPIAAGVTALLKEAKPDLTQAQAKEALQKTAANLGPAGWDPHSGYGVIRAKQALDRIVPSSGPGPRAEDWEPLGGFTVHAPAAATSGSRTDLFAIGIDNAIWHNLSDGTRWSGWRSLGGAWIATPTAIYRDEDRLHVFAIGFDRAVWQRTRDGSGWGSWTSLGGRCEYGLAVFSPAPDRMELFAIGPFNSLYRKSWSPGGWGEWGLVGDNLVCISAPAAAGSADRIEVFVIANDGLMHQSSLVGGEWTPWGALPGRWLLGLAAAGGDGRVSVFGISGSREVNRNSWDGVAWRGWESLGGRWYTGPAAISTRAGLNVFAVGADNAVYRRSVSAQPAANARETAHGNGSSRA